MKLRNKKTGEIIDVYKGEITLHYNQGRKTIHFKRLEDLEEWEDYKEPKEYWHIAELCGGLQRKQDADNGEDRFNKQIGNYFETEEEAEKAVEKLKAWKRLKDKGFRFIGINDDEVSQHLITECGILCEANIDYRLSKDEDFILLFGGEE